MLKEKKKYKFDYIRENVEGWLPEFKKNITKQMIEITPYGIFVWNDIIKSSVLDYYGESIEDFDEWKKQREEYIDSLYNELKK